MQIKKLHHHAVRCRNSEDTRKFYEDFLGMPLVHAIKIDETKTGRKTQTLHTFFRLGDGSHLAFFEAPDRPFEFKKQHDFDLHTALEVDQDTFDEIQVRAKNLGMEVRGISDHEIIHSIYLRDPNGYVVELCVKTSEHDSILENGATHAKTLLAEWSKRENHPG